MYIVNTSFFVDADVQNAWLEILKDKFIPFLRSEGCRIVSFCRVLCDGAADHFTFSLITEAEGLDQYNRYVDELFAEYERLAGMMFGQKVTSLTTLMKKIDHESED